MYRVGTTTSKRNKNQWGILRDRLLRLNTPAAVDDRDECFCFHMAVRFRFRTLIRLHF
jgi:hypothetical protein